MKRISRREVLAGVSASLTVAALPAVAVSDFAPIVWSYPRTYYGLLTFRADGAETVVWYDEDPAV
jgi:hypothetical protein